MIAMAQLSVFSLDVSSVNVILTKGSPLRIRVDLRDHWEKPDSPVQGSISTLSQVIGLPVEVTLETPMLWRELGKHYPEHDTFIPSVVEIVKSWAECLISRLEDDANEAWVEHLLEVCGTRLRAIIEVSRNTSRVSPLVKMSAHPLES